MEQHYIGFFELLAESRGCEFTSRKGKSEFAYIKNVFVNEYAESTEIHYLFELSKNSDSTSLSIKVMIGKGLNQNSFAKVGANWWSCYAGASPLNEYFAHQLLVHLGIEKHNPLSL